MRCTCTDTACSIESTATCDWVARADLGFVGHGGASQVHAVERVPNADGDGARNVHHYDHDAGRARVDEDVRRRMVEDREREFHQGLEAARRARRGQGRGVVFCVLVKAIPTFRPTYDVVKDPMHTACNVALHVVGAMQRRRFLTKAVLEHIERRMVDRNQRHHTSLRLLFHHVGTHRKISSAELLRMVREELHLWPIVVAAATGVHGVAAAAGAPEPLVPAARQLGVDELIPHARLDQLGELHELLVAFRDAVVVMFLRVRTRPDLARLEAALERFGRLYKRLFPEPEFSKPSFHDFLHMGTIVRRFGMRSCFPFERANYVSKHTSSSLKTDELAKSILLRTLENQTRLRIEIATRVERGEENGPDIWRPVPSAGEVVACSRGHAPHGPAHRPATR